MKKCKHMTLIRLDDKKNKMTSKTKSYEQSFHFQCDRCGTVFVGLLTDKPFLVEQVVQS